MEQKTQVAQLVTKDTTIGDFVQKYPSVVEILTDQGVHCVGCGAAVFETLEQGLKGHGKSDEVITKVIVDINEALALEGAGEAVSDELVFTESAAAKVKELLQKQAKEDYGLRVSVVAGGCSGFKYQFEFDKEADEGDFTTVVNGVKFFVDQTSLEQLKGARVDYVEALQGAGFKVENPNAKAGCGCGKSFH